MKSAIVRSVVCLALVCVSPYAARSGQTSEDYQPLTVGSHWEYRSAVLGEKWVGITGEKDILGVTTRVRQEVQLDQVYENYWSKDENGNVYLHGWVNFTYPAEVAYVPPIKMVEPPLFLGKAWVTTGIRCYDLDGTPWQNGPFDYPLRVYTEGIITVPAGDFDTYGVGIDVPFGLAATSRRGTFDVLGRRIAVGQSTEDNTTEWYSEGVGAVQSCVYTDREKAFKLVSFRLPSVATQATTWGQVKALYRE